MSVDSSVLNSRLDEAHRLFLAGDLHAAADIFEVVVETDPDCAPAWLGLGRLALTIPDLPSALDFFSRAVEILPGDANTLAWLGDAQRRAGLLIEALVTLRSASLLVPGDLLIACKLANAHIDIGELLLAKDQLSDLLAKCPNVPELYLLRGMTYSQMGSDGEAEADLRVCLSLVPDNCEALTALGDILREHKQLDEASRYIERAALLAPGAKDVLLAQGMLCLAKKDWRAANDFLAQRLELVPDDVLAAMNRAAALVELGDAIPAIDALEFALGLGVSEQWVHEMIGILFAHQGQWQVALENLEMAVEKEPQNLNAWNVLIVAYDKAGLMEKAEQAAYKALEINPEHVCALVNLAGWYINLGRHDEGVETFKRALALEPTNTAAHSALMFGMLFSSQPTAGEILEAGRHFDVQVCQPLFKVYSFEQRSKALDRVLRVGWVSSDLKAHPVGAFIAPFFPHLNPRLLETYIYDNWPKEDSVTAKIKPHAKVWRNIRGLGDNAAAECIRGDEIDILVDLNGHTAGHRLGIFARKPAPIQVEWLGFPGTSGMSAMDYVLVPDDDYLAAGGWSAEKPWRLPNCYGVRGGILDVAVRDNLPADENGYFTFACMNRYSKVSGAALDLWATLLSKVENSRLILIGRGGADQQTLNDLRARFFARGVAAERLEILESRPVNEYFDTYNRADLCLDPFPFNGGTTGFDSIWMGVPFVTLRGDALHSRAGSNILKYVGLSDLVAESEADYVSKAVAMANNLPALRAHRHDLRGRMKNSPLMDAAGFARGIEDSFRKMWVEWCLNGERNE